jgi:hypothetical protein
MGVTMALPLLDSMVPALTAQTKTVASLTPRLGFVYVPHGAIMDRWTPAAEGTGFEFSPILKPLEPFRDRVNIVSGLGHKAADTTAVHSLSPTTWMSGVRPKPTQGVDAFAGVTADQIAAKQIGQETLLPSLELATEDHSGLIGSCERDYGCIYMNTLSWRTPTTPLPLLYAIINGHYDAAAFLLDKGADPNLADKTGRTALYSAVDFNTMPVSNRPAPKVVDNEVSSLELIHKLLARGANPNAQLKTQQPYRTNLDRGDDTMLTTGTTPLLRAAKAGDVPAMRALLAKGADAKLATRTGINPLMAAAGLGTKEEDTTGRHKTEAEAIEAIQLSLEAVQTSTQSTAAGRRHCTGRRSKAMTR